MTESESSPPDRWLVLTLPLEVEPELQEQVVDFLMEGGFSDAPPRGLEERGDSVILYLPPPESGVAPLVQKVQAGLRALGAHTAAQGLRPSWQPHEAWAELWRQGFATRHITPRIVVTPSWIPAEPGPGETVIVLDPGMAFGTSEHPTTRGCLRLLDPILEPGSRWADVGSGSGILAIAAARLGAREVLAVELDPWASAAARENVERNAVEDRVRVVSRAVGPEFLPGEPPFDGVLANIEAGILRPLLPGFRVGVRPGGWLILSGILESEAPGMQTATEALGFTFHGEDREGEWWSGRFVREG